MAPLLTNPVSFRKAFFNRSVRGLPNQVGDYPRMENRIRELRERAGLTQAELAEAADTSFQQIYKLEQSKRKLSPQWMERLAPALGVRPSALVDRDVERLPDPETQSELVDDPDELALLWLWRGLTDDMRHAAFTLLQGQASRLGGKVA